MYNGGSQGVGGNIREAGRGLDGGMEGGKDASAARVEGTREEVQNSNLTK